jgi:hypothetical protein
MQQVQLTTYTDIAEVRAVTSAAACNQLLAEGWVLLGVYPLTTVAEMTSGGEQDTQPMSGGSLGLCSGRDGSNRVSKTLVFETIDSITKNFLLRGYDFVSKSVSLSTPQYLANGMSFDTLFICPPLSKRKNFSKPRLPLRSMMN